jgi:hypothetical protein
MVRAEKKYACHEGNYREAFHMMGCFVGGKPQLLYSGRLSSCTAQKPSFTDKVFSYRTGLFKNIYCTRQNITTEKMKKDHFSIFFQPLVPESQPTVPNWRHHWWIHLQEERVVQEFRLDRLTGKRRPGCTTRLKAVNFPRNQPRWPWECL